MLLLLEGPVELVMKQLKHLLKKGLSGVVLADLNIEQATISAQKLEEETGCHCYPCKVDVSIPQDIEHLFEFALEKMPTVHILINGAGVCPTTPIEDLDADKWAPLKLIFS